MNTRSGHTVTIEMPLWQANVHERIGKRREAANIRGWVADLLCEQSRLLRSVWHSLPKPGRATPNAICSEHAVRTKASGEWHAETRSNPIQLTYGSRKPWADLRQIDFPIFPRATAIAGPPDLTTTPVMDGHGMVSSDNNQTTTRRKHK